MLTLFIPFLLNMETFAWLMPLVHAPAQLCTYAGCTRVCRQGCTHMLRAPVLRRTLVLLQSLASFQDIENCLKNNCYLHTGFHNVVPSLQGRFSFIETSVGIPGGWLGGSGNWNGRRGGPRMVRASPRTLCTRVRAQLPPSQLLLRTDKLHLCSPPQQHY